MDLKKVAKIFDEEFKKSKKKEKENKKNKPLTLHERWDIDSDENALHFSDE